MNTAHLERVCAAVLILSLLLATAAVAQTFLLTAGSGGTINATNGPAVVLGQDLGLSGENPVGTDGSVTIQNTTIDGPAGSTATLSDPSSTSPLLEAIDTNSGELEANTTGIQRVNISGGITRLEYRDVDLQDDQTVELDADGTGTLHVHGFQADEWLRVNRASGDDTLLQTDSAGVLSIPVSNGAEITVVQDGGGPTLSDPSPTSGTFSNPPVTFEVNVSDPDFDTATENVTLEWSVNGTVVGTTHVTSNGTATFTSPVDTGGTHDWHVTATDATSQTDRSPATGNHTYSLPSELHLFEETNPDTLISTNNANVTVRFFAEGSDQVIERSPTGGTVDLAGLPTDEEFIVTVDAEGYHYRRIIVDSLIEQQDVFLLPDDATAATIIFELNDQTGRFPSDDTRLYVERALNQSNTTTYRVIAGDRFGASGEFPVPLQDNERYRLRIENDQGETRALGAYTTSGDDRAVLPIGVVDISASETEDLVVQANIQQVTDPALSYNYTARVFVLDEAQQTSSFNLTITNSTGAVVRPTSTHSGPWGRYIETFPLSNYTAGETYYVEVNATRNSELRSFRKPIGDLPELPGEWPIDPWVLQLIGYVSIVALLGFLAIWNPTLAALAVIPYAAILTTLGIVPIPGIAIGVAGSAAVLYRLGGDL